MMLFVTVALVAVAMIAAGAFPTFAKEQTKTKGEGRGVGAGACRVPSVEHGTIQAAVDDPSCQPIVLNDDLDPVQVGTTIDRDVRLTGDVIIDSRGKSAFTILPGNTVTFEDFLIDGGGGASVEQGGGIYNQGTLLLNNVSVRSSSATNGGGIYNEGTLTIQEEDGGRSSVFLNTAASNGGGIYNQGTLYLCGATVTENEAPPGIEDNISGTPAQQCPTGPPGEGPSKGGNGVLLDHKGKALCLPETALNGHLNHGDEVIDEEGCSEEPAAKQNGKAGRAGVMGAGGRTS